MTSPRSLATLADHEQAARATRPIASRRIGRGRGQLPSARVWLLVAVTGVAWSLWDAGVGRKAIVNPGGWQLVRRFWAAAAHPQLSPDFVLSTWHDTLTTIGFAVLGTALALIVGLVGAIAMSETWWQRESSLSSKPQLSGVRRRGWYATRTLWGIPRGIHEAVWGLYLVNILGRDPLVGILAIAIPFGAITAKVYAELIDESAGDTYRVLRAAGSGRLVSLAYGAIPNARADLVSYAFYRLECSVRSAVILGMIGAGGLGFRLSLSFQGLAYREMWTTIYALIVVSALADWWGSWLRRAPNRTRMHLSLVAGAALVVVSAAELRPDIGRLFTARSRKLATDLALRSWPPSAPRDGWWGLARRAVETFQMSLLAIAIAGLLAIGVAFVAARGATSRPRRLVAFAARGVLLVTRAIPAPVWALLVLFVVYPGPIPGALALGIYNFGILGRLCAEVVENLDPGPATALDALGAHGLSTFAYATLAQASTRFATYSLYRWEVALRETVIVGVVGAGGLGRLLEQQRAAFDYSAMFATVLALLAASLIVDLLSTAARRSLR